MNARLLITLVLFMACLSTVKSQNIPTYPIPSYNILVDGTANFRNALTQKDTCKNFKEKRDANIHLKSASIGNPDCRATVWVYSLDLSTILGPYQVSCGETLTVPIDEREWGVIVQSDSDVIVDVWFE
jgi:hypothetical protein